MYLCAPESLFFMLLSATFSIYFIGGFNMLVRKTLKVMAIFVFVGLLSVTPSFAADEPALTVGSVQMSETEILQMLASTAGGNNMMVGMILGQSTLKDRKELLNQMADAIIFSEAAKNAGLDRRSDIAFQLKWQGMQTLLQAYLQQISSKWDLSEKAMQTYYNTHKNEFVQAAAAKTRHILTETEGDALTAALQIYKTKDFGKVASEYSRDPNTANNGGELGWVEKGMMAVSVDKAINEAKVGSLVGPVKSEFGWHIIEVTDRRPAKQLSFSEASDEVVQRLQRQYLDKELTALKKKYTISINDKILENLGGVPAPAEQK